MVRMPHWPQHFFYEKLRFDFSRFNPLMQELGFPNLKMKNVIHVAGTNGKGSTVSFIGSILEHHGYKVHTYISPHLLEFNERIMLYGQKITDKYLFEVTEKARLAEEKLGIKLTFFEGGTASAFIAFAENPADFIVLETGMGGQFDATNVAENKISTVITPISYDHTEYLGNTLEEIAYTKAGIMRKNVPCIISMQTNEAFDELENYAAKLGAKTISFGYEFGVVSNDHGFSYQSDSLNVDLSHLSLAGDHQLVNASTAIAAIEQLSKDGYIKIDEEKLSKAIANTKWMGRLQQITDGYLHSQVNKNLEIWLDGAHNPSGGQIMGSWLEKFPDQNIYLILGMTKNRDVSEFIKYIIPHLKAICCVYVYEEPSSYKSDVLQNLASKTFANSVEADSLEDAIYLINKDYELNGQGKPGKIIACGSLYLVAMFLRENYS